MLPHHLYFLVVGTEIKKKVTKMTVYNVEKALFIYKIVTKTQKSAAANLNLEMKYVFFVIFLCAVDTQASLKKT